MKSFLFLALLSTVALLAGSAPALAQDNASQVRPVAVFQSIKVGSGIELTLTAGREQRVEVSASTTELRDRILTSVEGGVLTIRYDNPNKLGGNNSMRNQHLRVAIVADQLTALTAGSGSAVQSSGNVAAAAGFRLDVSSGATVRAELTTAALTVRQSSGSTTALNGRAPRLDVDLSSGATFDGGQLLTEQCRAAASSGASIDVAVAKELTARASSGASIRYRGQPQVTKVVSSGGSVSGG